MLGQIFDTASTSHNLWVVEHFRPIILLIDDLMNEGAASRMIPTVATMDFLHHSPSFVLSETPQKGVDMKLGVRFLVNTSPKSVYLVAKCRGFCASTLSSGSIPSFR